MANTPIRATKQRQVILDIVLNSMDHPSSDIVYERAIKVLPNISLGTVYRNLAQLVAAGQIRQISMPQGPDRYDCNMDTHCHLVCTSCNEIYDLDAEGMHEKIHQDAQRQGFQISHINLLNYGTCPKCLKDRQNEYKQ